MKYKSPISESIHSIAAALNAAGAISHAEMKEYNRFCLTPIEPLDGAALKLLTIVKNKGIEAIM